MFADPGSGEGGMARGFFCEYGAWSTTDTDTEWLLLNANSPPAVMLLACEMWSDPSMSSSRVEIRTTNNWGEKEINRIKEKQCDSVNCERIKKSNEIIIWCITNGA